MKRLPRTGCGSRTSCARRGPRGSRVPGGAVIRADHYAIMRNEGLTAEILDALALEYALD